MSEDRTVLRTLRRFATEEKAVVMSNTSANQQEESPRMPRSIWTALIAVVVLTTAAWCAPVDKLVICDFERDSDAARFVVRTTTPPSRLAISTQHATGGTHSASISFPKWQEGSEQWPAVILSTDKGLPADWSGYDAVACEIFNASASEVDLGFFLQDALGKRASEHFSLAPGKSTTMRMALDTVPADFDLKRVSQFHIFTTRPPEPISVFVDDIRLESDAIPRLTRAGDLIDRLRRDSKDCAAEMAPLLNELDETYADLCYRVARAADSAALRKLRPEIVAFETKLRTQTARAIPEARLRTAARKLSTNSQYACGFASSMEKVFPRDVPFTCSTAREATIELAGNETECIQLLIYAFAQDLKNTSVTIGPLKAVRSSGNLRNSPGRNSEKGASRRAVGSPPGLVVQVSPVGFVETKKPPYPVRYVGWHPDPILDFLKSFDVRKGEVQPVWIRVKAPTGTPAGDYQGPITVKAANARPTTLTLNVRVWGFDLPRQTHLRTAMSLYDHFLANAYGTVTEPMRAKYEDFVLSYRINPDNIYRSEPPPIKSLLRWERQGLNAFNILYVRKPDGLKAGDPYPPDRKQAILAKLDEVIPQLKENGLYSKAYVYGFDEIGPESYAAMKDIFGAIKAKYPDLLTLTTGRDHTYGEASGVDTVDAWCPLTPYYDLDRAAKARARGKQVWWYTCIGPKEPFANWLIEYDAIDARVLMGLQTAKYQPDGYLYYAMMRWPLTKKPITSGPYTDWPPASYNDCNGDGSIICAGPDGPLATIRLENIRDGIEDNEYFWLLRQEIKRLQVRSDTAARNACLQAEKALTIGDDLVKSMSSFTKSPDALLAKRRQVAEAILAARKVP